MCAKIKTFVLAADLFKKKNLKKITACVVGSDDKQMFCSESDVYIHTSVFLTGVLIFSSSFTRAEENLEDLRMFTIEVQFLL